MPARISSIRGAGGGHFNLFSLFEGKKREIR